MVQQGFSFPWGKSKAGEARGLVFYRNLPRRHRPGPFSAFWSSAFLSKRTEFFSRPTLWPLTKRRRWRTVTGSRPCKWCCDVGKDPTAGEDMRFVFLSLGNLAGAAKKVPSIGKLNLTYPNLITLSGAYLSVPNACGRLSGPL